VKKALGGVASLLAVLLLVSAAVFALIRSAPGDPVDVELGPIGTAGLTAAEEDAIRAERHRQLGLDRPIPVQYARWLARVSRGDLGTSYRSRQPVLDELLSRLPASAALGAAGLGVGGVLAVVLAGVSARRPGGPADQAIRLGSLVAASAPTFLTGLLALAVFARDAQGYQVTGPATWGRLWLPALVLGVSSAPTMLRLLRSSLVAERGRLYAVAAVARGAGPGRLLVRHIGRRAVAPFLALAGLTTATLITGSIITETVFSWPGVGRLAVDAIGAQDHPVVQGYVLMVTAIVVAVNAAVEVLQRLVDPTVADTIDSAS
jgi:ABC-type dipeptide/oligopeptide/nickel transport system permease component